LDFFLFLIFSERQNILQSRSFDLGQFLCDQVFVLVSLMRQCDCS
jgi:hypothetical protein